MLCDALISSNRRNLLFTRTAGYCETLLAFKFIFLCTETYRTAVRTAIMDWTALSRMLLNKSCGDEKKLSTE